MYYPIVKKLLSLSKKYGGKTGHRQQVEFFFYADSEDKGSNLAIELSRLAYEVYGVERYGYQWSVIGATPLMKVDEKTLACWADEMNSLADKMEVKFDGFGMMIEK